MKRAYEQATAHRNRNALRNKVRLDRNVRACEFNEGDTVFILKTNKKKETNNKFIRKWVEIPYRIKLKTGPVNYLVEALSDSKITRVVHQTQLKRAYLDRLNTLCVPSDKREVDTDYCERMRGRVQSDLNNTDYNQDNSIHINNSMINIFEFDDTELAVHEIDMHNT